MGGIGAFWGTRIMQIVKKHDSGGLLWKRIKLTSTRKANAKMRLRRVWQPGYIEVLIVMLHPENNDGMSVDMRNEAVLKACSEEPPSKSNGLNDSIANSGQIRQDS